jgi:hypothetical protein
MRTVQDIYDAYRIMPSLQLHQLRVAGVGLTVCRALTRDVDERAVVLACLFHDMGNIIKSDLSIFPGFLEPEGRAHWELVKSDFIEQYGRSEHDATRQIVTTLRLNRDVIGYIDGIGFSKLESVRDSSSFELKICQYADLRVGPHGVLSMEARMQEGRARYELKHLHDEDEWQRLTSKAYAIEAQLFAETDIAPGDIVEEGIAPLRDELRRLEI